MITVHNAPMGGQLHWGVTTGGNAWQTPLSSYPPAGSSLFNGTGPAVESPMSGPDSNGRLVITLGPFDDPAQVVDLVDFVIHYNDNSWDNNHGSDYHIPVNNSIPVDAGSAAAPARALHLHPNPTTARCWLTISGEPLGTTRLEMFDSNGRLRHRQYFGGNRALVEWPELEAGIYLLRIERVGLSKRMMILE